MLQLQLCKSGWTFEFWAYQFRRKNIPWLAHFRFPIEEPETEKTTKGDALRRAAVAAEGVGFLSPVSDPSSRPIAASGNQPPPCSCIDLVSVRAADSPSVSTVVSTRSTLSCLPFDQLGQLVPGIQVQ